jgi:hypothetical protein
MPRFTNVVRKSAPAAICASAVCRLFTGSLKSPMTFVSSDAWGL